MTTKSVGSESDNSSVLKGDRLGHYFMRHGYTASTLAPMLGLSEEEILSYVDGAVPVPRVVELAIERIVEMKIKQQQPRRARPQLRLLLGWR